MIILNKLFHSFILSSLGKINVDKRGTTHQKCRMSEKWNRSWNGERVAGRGSRVAGRGSRVAGRETLQGMEEPKYEYECLKGLQYSCDCKETSRGTLCRQLCGVTQFLSAR